MAKKDTIDYVMAYPHYMLVEGLLGEGVVR